MEEMQKKGKIALVDKVIIRGRLHYTVYKRVNGVKRVLEVCDDQNLVLTLGKVQMAHLIAGDFQQRNIAKFGVGEGMVPPELPDTELKAGAYIKAIDDIEYPEDGHVRFNWSLDESEANGMAITEFGLFCLDNVMFSRRIRQNETTLVIKPLNKEDDISFHGYWEIMF